MEKLLFKKGRKGFRRDFIAALNPSLFRYAPLHKEGFNNSKQYLGLKKMCKFESGLISNKCKLFLGRVTLADAQNVAGDDHAQHQPHFGGIG
jgi:hypothetical protein